MSHGRASTWYLPRTRAWTALCLLALCSALRSQDVAATRASARAELSALVVDETGKPVGDARVTLLAQDGTAPLSGKTDAGGELDLQLSPGTYTLRSERNAARSKDATLILVAGGRQQVRSVLFGSLPAGGPAPGALSNLTPELSDKPSFSVAGVTDWTAVGGHGSDAVLRTSESLTRDTVELKMPGAAGTNLQRTQPAGGATETQLKAALRAAPQSYETNHNLGMYYLQARRYQDALSPLESAAALSHQAAEDEYSLAQACQGVHDLPQAQAHLQRALKSKDEARLHHLAGQVAEQMGDPLTAVKEQELATRMEPSEPNYFDLGSELLRHRAIWQASQVFASGAHAFPDSARIQAAWGTALYAGARYDESARRLCAASDLDPSNVAPYEFIGRIAAVSSTPEPCVRQRLERFLQLMPTNAGANFFLALLFLKQGGLAETQRAKELLERAVALRPGYAEAHLQLGILAFARLNYDAAIQEYKLAILADSQLGEAHYRLAVAYDHVGKPELAHEEFVLHDEIDRAQAEAVEEQRREIKQFVIAPQVQTSQTTHP